jgi:curved DNA-binding protein CbpA
MFTLPPDPYKILGVSSKAQLAEIRSAHRKLILKCHPDKVQDPQLRAEKQSEFQRVQQAYELLIDEKERDKYDSMVQLNELQKDRAKMPTSSSARTPPRHNSAYPDVDIRTAEPRPSTFATFATFATGTSPSYGTRTPRNRSWEDELNTRYHESPRTAHRTASYEPFYEEDRHSKRDGRQRRRDEELFEREKERDRQRAEQAEANEKKSRRTHERNKERKRVDKERKRDTTEKRHTKERDPYIEEFSDQEPEVIFLSHKKKPSSSRRHEEPPVRASSRPPPEPAPTSERSQRMDEQREYAQQYLERSGTRTKPGISRAKTYHESYRHVDPPTAPTPPPAPFAAPPRARDILVDDRPKPSSRRPSDAGHRSSRDKSAHKKSSTRAASREPRTPPVIVDPPPSSSSKMRHPPTFKKSHTAPLAVPTEPRIPPLSRSSTDQYSRPIPQATHSAEASRNWLSDSDRERSRAKAHASYSEESSEEDERRFRRGSRRTHSPEPVSRTETYRYNVENGRTVRQAHHPEELSRSRGSKGSYSTHHATPVYDYDDYGADGAQYFTKVKYAPQFDENEISYSGLRRGYREPVY